MTYRTNEIIQIMEMASKDIHELQKRDQIITEMMNGKDNTKNKSINEI
jgi:acetyl-CoA carboxylase alpha subunit